MNKTFSENLELRLAISDSRLRRGLDLVNYAVIDLGSYTAKLTIACIDKDIAVLQKDETSIGLGQGFGEDKILKPEAIQTASGIIKAWKGKIRKYDVAMIGVFATGVSQVAKNKRDLIDYISRETGLELRILSEEDEAEALFKGVMTDFPDDLTYVTLNVGGNTTRVIVGKRNCIEELHCVHTGTIELNRLLHSDPPGKGEVNTLENTIEARFSNVSPCKAAKKSVLIHTGGELDYVLAAGCKLTESTLSPTHPYKILLDDFEDFALRIRKTRKEILRSFRPQNPKWMEGAIVSNTIATYIAKKFDVSEIIPSNRNITDGLLLALQEQARHGKKAD
jgi:exopolyphosphatase/guanosine-5'-triphosphate,3'-diphosphate pyrophosphatase